MSVCQPTQQIGHVTAIGTAETLTVVGADSVGEGLHRGGQRSGVVGNLPGVRDDHRKQSGGFGQCPAID